MARIILAGGASSIRKAVTWSRLRLPSWAIWATEWAMEWAIEILLASRSIHYPRYFISIYPSIAPSFYLDLYTVSITDLRI